MTKETNVKLFENRKVRSVWDSEQEKWYISIVDVIEVLTESPNPRKYWSVLKTRLKQEGSEEAVSKVCHPALDAGSHEKTLLIIKGLRVKPAMT